MHRVGSRSIRTVRQQQHDHRESGRVRIVGMHTLSDRQEVQAQGVGSEALLPRLIKPLSSRSLAIRPPGSILIEWSHPTDRNGGALFFSSTKLRRRSPFFCCLYSQAVDGMVLFIIFQAMTTTIRNEPGTPALDYPTDLLSNNFKRATKLAESPIHRYSTAQLSSVVSGFVCLNPQSVI